MKARGFLTQCVGGNWSWGVPAHCPKNQTARREKPGAWRCEWCEAKFGSLAVSK